MRWGIPRIVVGTALVALLALGLVACGGDDESSSPSATEGTADAGAREAGSGSGEEQQGGDGGEQQQGGGNTGPEASEGFEPAPLRVSGGGSSQFRVKGGDNSIQDFGEEADESELEKAAEAVHDFYVARAEGEWADACSYLAASLLEQLEQLAAESERKGCAPFLEAFTTPLSDDAWREITMVDAESLREDGEQAFLIYRGARNEVYSMPLDDEDGEWKVTALLASTLG